MFTRLRRDEEGAVAVMAALLLSFALLALSSIVVDAGYLYDSRAQLQSAADAGALAGCWELIRTDDSAAAESVARAAALENAQGPGANLTVTAVNVDMSDYSVQVEVGANARTFFSRQNGPASLPVVAAARAARQSVSGGRYLWPWALPIVLDDDVDYVETFIHSGATVVSGPVNLSGSAPRTYTGSISAPGSAGGYDLDINVRNIFGIDEPLGSSTGEQPAARIVVPPAGYPFTSIQVHDDFMASDAPVWPTIEVHTATTQTAVYLAIGKKNKVALAGSGTSWSHTFNATEIDLTDKMLVTHAVDVFTGAKADGFVDSYVHVRRSSNPYLDVNVSPTVIAAGGTIDVSVQLNEFDPAALVPGRIYTLRVGGDGVETGNFEEVDFAKIVHQPSCPPQVAGTGGGNIHDWLFDGGFSGAVHVGDIVPTSPGKSGFTATAVSEFLATTDGVIVVPIVAKYEDKGSGRYDTIVRTFAAFRITDYEDTGSSKGDVQGEFIQYVVNPASFGGNGQVFAPRLINPVTP